ALFLAFAPVPAELGDPEQMADDVGAIMSGAGHRDLARRQAGGNDRRVVLPVAGSMRDRGHAGIGPGVLGRPGHSDRGRVGAGGRAADDRIAWGLLKSGRPDHRVATRPGIVNDHRTRYDRPTLDDHAWRRRDYNAVVGLDISTLALDAMAPAEESLVLVRGG